MQEMLLNLRRVCPEAVGAHTKAEKPADKVKQLKGSEETLRRQGRTNDTAV